MLLSVDNEAIKVLASEMKKCAEEVMNNSNFDRTVKGRILTYSGNNKYQVQLSDGQKYQATSFNVYNINEIVFITIPSGNYNDLFIVSSATSTNVSSSWTLEDRPLGINL